MEKESDIGFRTKQFALRIIKLCGLIPNTPAGRVISGQVLRSGTSPGAQYREAKRARSTKEFISKMGGGLQELEETLYWLELLVEAKLITQKKLEPLMNENNELIAMFVASIKTATKASREVEK